MENREVRSFCEENNIELLILFGSHVSGEIHPESDIDVAVKLREGTEVSKLELIYRLHDLFGEREVDLVILTTNTDPLLLYEIFSKGIPIYEKNEGIFEAEKLRAWKLYLDTQRLRTMQKKYLKEFAERVSNLIKELS